MASEGGKQRKGQASTHIQCVKGELKERLVMRLYTMEIKGVHNNILSGTGHIPIFMSTDFRLLIVAIWMISGDITF
jgi:hypothetical protein